MIELRNISKTFKSKNEDIEILKNISFTINANEISLIYGHSGVGKSTLLSIIGTLIKPTQGNLLYHNKKITYDSDLSYLRRESIGFIFQDNYLLPEYNIIENLIVPQLINGESFNNARKKSKDMLELIELEHLSSRYYSEISGGEKQRISLIRSLINNPDIVIADEPTANLDEKNCKQLLDLIVKLNKELGKSFLIATHDDRLKSISNSIYKLFNGELIKNG